MRAATDGVTMPYPIGSLLPAVLQADPALLAWTSGLDDVLAPIVGTLDCLAAYVEPGVAPADFVAWLAGWVGVDLGERDDLDSRRRQVAEAVRAHRQRGTAVSLRRAVESAAGPGSRVGIDGLGEVVGHAAPTETARGEPLLLVRVRLGPSPRATVAELNQVVARAKPAHLPHRLEVEP